MAPPADRRAGSHAGGPRGRRPFDYGALRLIVLGMITEAPRHGYELIKTIEERMGGGYSPSPGVIYPTLSWLEDMGFALPEVDGGRKRYRITPEGEAFLVANRATLDELTGRMKEPGGRRNAPEAVLEAMHELKRALRARFLRGPVDAAGTEQIAAAIRAATRNVEKTMPTYTTAGLRSIASVTTPKAAGYAARLCKHFSHKIPATFVGSDGEVSFPMGTCHLHAAGETLTLIVEGPDAAAVERLQEVVASHLVRFAFREELVIDWQTPQAA